MKALSALIVARRMALLRQCLSLALSNLDTDDICLSCMSRFCCSRHASYIRDMGHGGMKPVRMTVSAGRSENWGPCVAMRKGDINKV